MWSFGFCWSSNYRKNRTKLGSRTYPSKFRQTRIDYRDNQVCSQVIRVDQHSSTVTASRFPRHGLRCPFPPGRIFIAYPHGQGA